MTSFEDDPLHAALDAENAKLERVYRVAKSVLDNYDEFGVEGGLDERMEGLRKVLREIAA